MTITTRMPVAWRGATAPGTTASPSAAAPGRAVGVNDRVTLSKVEELHKRAERLHGAGDTLGLFSMFGMIAYVPAICVATSLLFPNAGPALGPIQIGSGLLTAGGIIGTSVYVTKKGNQLRAQAEALNKQLPSPTHLDWGWAVR